MTGSIVGLAQAAPAVAGTISTSNQFSDVDHNWYGSDGDWGDDNGSSGDDNGSWGDDDGSWGDDDGSWGDDDGGSDDTGGGGAWTDDSGPGRHRGERHQHDTTKHPRGKHGKAHQPVHKPPVHKPVHKPVTKVPGHHPAGPPEGTPSHGKTSKAQAKAIAKEMIPNAAQYSCFAHVIQHESNWDVTEHDPSGAYGLPQALPGRKMASAGSDWRTNPRTQIKWAIKYMDSRYGSPCGAWSHWQSHRNY
jgi:hypothetical protein